MAAGLHRLELGSVDLREVIRHVEDLYLPHARLSETSLHVECGGPLVGHWDGLALEQAIGSLVSNAIKFGAGKPVVLTADDPGTGVIKVQVADRGTGISEADQQRMFDQFEQVMLTTDQSKGGFGIGLWLARNLAEAHGGHIAISSVPGTGSTFTLSLSDFNEQRFGGIRRLPAVRRVRRVFAKALHDKRRALSSEDASCAPS